MKKIAVIGGGTGTFTVLTGLRKYSDDLSAIVTMSDSGGSSGLLRDELGVLPPGDIRQCLIALSNADKIWRDLFNYRFGDGGLSGHNFGNIFLSTLEKITGSLDTAIKTAGQLLQIKGRVIPVTFDKVNLCVKLSNQKTIKGETHIDEPRRSGKYAIVSAYLEPQAFINPEAASVILKADVLLFGPGDLYTSIIPNLLVRGFGEAVKKTKASLVFTMNLMTKYGQTNNLTAKGHLGELEKYLGKEVDIILVNKTLPSKQAALWYKSRNEEMVKDDLGNDKRVRRLDLLHDVVFEKNKNI